MSQSSGGEEKQASNKFKVIIFLQKIIHNFCFKLFQKKQSSSSNIAQTSNILMEHPEGKIVNNVDQFYTKIVEDIMIPRADIIAASNKATLQKLVGLITEHSYTRMPIYKENLDEIIGFIHIKDLFVLIANAKKFILKKIIRQHIICTHSMKIIDLLTQMQVKRTHIAVVVDEYGGTDGIVTIEDIMEAIVGRIDDEHDIENIETYKMLRPGLLVLSARMEIKELEKIIGVKLKTDQDEFDTIGGLVMAKAGNVPTKGAIIEFENGITIEIIDSTPRRIKYMKINYLV